MATRHSTPVAVNINRLGNNFNPKIGSVPQNTNSPLKKGYEGSKDIKQDVNIPDSDLLSSLTSVGGRLKSVVCS